MAQKAERTAAEVSVSNIGGIDTCTVTFEEGVTILSGQNATNRTSLLTAIESALGGSSTNLKSDYDEGYVSLDIAGETYTRQFTRRGEEIVVTGEPYCDDEQLVDLFVSQLEDNPVRRAVEQNENLRDILMAPVDVETIEQRIRTLRRKKEDTEERIEEISRELDRLPTLVSKRQELEENLDAVEAEIEELQATIEDHDSTSQELEETKEIIDQVEGLRQELKSKQQKIETQRSSIDALREERAEIEDELADLAVPDANPADIEAERAHLQSRERDLAETINTLSSILEFNEELLESEEATLPSSDTEGDVTAELDPMSEQVECWTCGSEVPRQDIRDKLDELEALLEEKREQRSEINSDIDQLHQRLESINSIEDRKSSLQGKKESVTEEIEERERRIDTLESESDEIRREIEEIEEKISDSQLQQKSDTLDKYQKLSKLEYDRGRLEQEICELDTEIEDLEDLSEERESLTEQVDEYSQELDSLRTHIQSRERDVIETFNDHMDELMDILNYENLSRVWIERERTDEGSSPIDRSTQSNFELHIVRQTDGGEMYRDHIDTLSESEREVIGLVVSLAGYLAHEVHETVPFMLLDSLEAIDSARIADLIDYFREFVPYLIVALLPADEQAVANEFRRVTADQLAVEGAT